MEAKNLGYRLFVIKNPAKVNICPIGGNSPNLLTLVTNQNVVIIFSKSDLP
jgi:hypothetical protein